MKNEIILGMKKSFPICIGYFPLGLAFGVIAQNYGMNPFEVGLMSILLFSGSGQFITVAMMTIGASFFAILITILLVNSRYLLFSAALSLHLKKFPSWLVGIITAGITDETFVVSTTHFKENKPESAFWLALNVTSHLSWICSTILGAYVGNFIPDMETFGLNFALPAMFIALFFMTAENRLMVTTGIFAGVVSMVLISLGFTDSNILLATLIAASLGVVLKRWKTN